MTLTCESASQVVTLTWHCASPVRTLTWHCASQVMILSYTTAATLQSSSETGSRSLLKQFTEFSRLAVRTLCLRYHFTGKNTAFQESNVRADQLTQRINSHVQERQQLRHRARMWRDERKSTSGRRVNGSACVRVCQSVSDGYVTRILINADTRCAQTFVSRTVQKMRCSHTVLQHWDYVHL